MSYAGFPFGQSQSSSFSNSDPQLRNMMLAQMLMRYGQQPQGGMQTPWSSLAGAGGNVVQAMIMQRLLGQQNPNQPGPTPQPPIASRPPTPLGPTGQAPGPTPMGNTYPMPGQNPTFPGGIAPFGSSGGPGSLY